LAGYLISLSHRLPARQFVRVGEHDASGRHRRALSQLIQCRARGRRRMCRDHHRAADWLRCRGKERALRLQPHPARAPSNLRRRSKWMAASCSFPARERKRSTDLRRARRAASYVTAACSRCVRRHSHRQPR